MTVSCFLLLLLLLPFHSLLLFPSSTLAFDTGHHYDILRNVLSDQGFGQTAIEITQVQNWLTDYISQDLFNENKGELGLLHFDNLFSTQNIIDYWKKLAVNTKSAITSTVSEQDPIKTLTIIGISLHAVQDFYTHSNFTELFRNDPAAFPQTWWHNNFNITENEIILHTGYTNSYRNDHEKENFDNLQPHGGYFDGLNKDSYMKPGWKSAYTLCYAGTLEWVNAITTWIREFNQSTAINGSVYLEEVKSVVLSEQDQEYLEDGLRFTYRISEYVDSGPADFADGHWKGKGSGDATQFVTIEAEYITSDFVDDSVFYRLFDEDQIYDLLSNNLEVDSPAPSDSQVPVIPAYNFSNTQVVLVRILHVNSDNPSAISDPDFYARVTIQNQEFIDAVQNSEESIQPFWTSMKFLPAQASPPLLEIIIQQWEEDPDDDEEYDINPVQDAERLTMQFNITSHELSGDVRGICDDVSSPCVLSGCEDDDDDDSATISFYITSFFLNQTIIDEFDIPAGTTPPTEPSCPSKRGVSGRSERSRVEQYLRMKQLREIRLQRNRPKG